MLGVTLGGDDAGDPVAFMRAHGFTYKILLKGDEMSALYNAAVLPALYLVGDESRPRRVRRAVGVAERQPEQTPGDPPPRETPPVFISPTPPQKKSLDNLPA